jgi:hypothetical protein
MIASMRACCWAGTAGGMVCLTPLIAMVAARNGRSWRVRLRLASPLRCWNRAKAVVDGEKAARTPRFVKTRNGAAELDEKALARARRFGRAEGLRHQHPGHADARRRGHPSAVRSRAEPGYTCAESCGP